MADMQRYLELSERARSLQERYAKKAAELDPLRWELIEAQQAATAEWRRVMLSNGDDRPK